MTPLSLALVALLTQAPDAPLLKDAPAIEVKAGDVVGFDGVCMGSAKSIQVGKRIADCEQSMAVVETKTVISTPVLVGGLVAVFGVAFALGVAAAFATR